MSLRGPFDDLTAWLDGFSRPLVLSHRRPDGDALGALAAMALALQQRGRQPLVALYEPFPVRYRLLENLVNWHNWDQVRAKAAHDCDAVVLLDTCSWQQLEPAREFLAAAPPTAVIDHHTTADSIGTRQGDFRLIDPQASATCLLLYQWMQVAGLRLDVPIATALFVGITTDCGWFRFANTDAQTLRVAADLLERGIDAAAIYDAIYQQDSEGRVRLIARMLSSLELHAGGRLAVMYIRRSDFDATGTDGRVTEDLVNEAARLASTEATLLFTEEPDAIRVNFRSKRALDVARLAQRFGGGGHARAAGARLGGPWAQVVPQVIADTTAALEALPQSGR
jgi:phosphoesterase RecJ-like protein